MKIVLRHSLTTPTTAWLLSAAAVHWLAARRSPLVVQRPLSRQEHLRYDASLPLEGPVDLLDRMVASVPDSRDLAVRAHRDLVACIEALGARATPWGGADLVVCEVPDATPVWLTVDPDRPHREWVTDGHRTWPVTGDGIGAVA